MSDSNEASLQRRPKVFCIGLHKTGTTSLAAALSHLGYRVTGPNFIRRRDLQDNVHELVKPVLAEYDAFRDNPWPILYRELNRWHTDGKFILTVRETTSWLLSVKSHFGTASTPMRKWIYGEGCGSPVGNEQIYGRRFDQHTAEVVAYFEASPNFLVLDIMNGDDWPKLCSFLQLPCPDTQFPWLNRSTSS